MSSPNTIIIVASTLSLILMVVVYGQPQFYGQISLKQEIDAADDSRTIMFSQVPMSNLVQQCFNSIPHKYRERCLYESFERYANSLYPQKIRCCTKWSQIECLSKYTYNTIYCNMHQQAAIKRYFAQIYSTRADGSPECMDYRPIEEEQRSWTSDVGRVAKCSPNFEYMASVSGGDRRD